MRSLSNSQECTVCVRTALDDECKIVKKSISDKRNAALAAIWLDVHGDFIYSSCVFCCARCEKLHTVSTYCVVKEVLYVL